MKLLRLQEEMKEAEQALNYTVSRCNHRWGDTFPDHIYHEGYTIPGDAPGTMGVDWRGPCYVNSSTEYRWKRQCTICGKVETTTRTTDRVEKIPTF